jgi:hypothetical protein
MFNPLGVLVVRQLALNKGVPINQANLDGIVGGTMRQPLGIVLGLAMAGNQASNASPAPPATPVPSGLIASQLTMTADATGLATITVAPDPSVKTKVPTPQGNVTLQLVSSSYAVTQWIIPLGAGTGTAQFSLTAPVGTYTANANYGGDSNFQAASFSGTLTLGTKTATSTAVASNPKYQGFVNVTVTVNVPVGVMIARLAAVGGSPSGTVTLTVTDAAGNANAVAPIVLNAASNGIANFDLSALPQGNYSVTANFKGDAQFADSVSAQIKVQI